MPDEAVHPPITRANTCEEFLKAHSRTDSGELRLGPGTVALFYDALNRLALVVAQNAATLARKDGRTTLMDKDIRAAYDAVVWTVDSTTTASPEILFSQINRLPTDALAALVRQVNDWLAAQARPTP